VRIQEEPGRSPAPLRSISLGRDYGFCDVPLLRRVAVGCDSSAGPAVIESYDTTILVPPGCTYRADGVGNIVIEIGD
jgi:N-methylhydantoinase A